MIKVIELDKKDFFNKEIDSPLRKVSAPIVSFDEELKYIIEVLKETFYSYKISVGLAAPQIGINKRVVIINIDKDRNNDIIMINPEILTNTGKKKVSFESCLSVPKHKGNVTRKDRVKVKYLDENKEEKTLEASGFFSRVILHEIDHLNGVLCVDHFESEIEKVDFKWE